MDIIEITNTIEIIAGLSVNCIINKVMPIIMAPNNPKNRIVPNMMANVYINLVAISIINN